MLRLRGQRNEDGARVAHQLTLKTCHCLGLSGRAQGNHQGPYEVEEGDRRENRTDGSLRRPGPGAAGFEQGGMGRQQGMWAAFGSWRR